MEESRSEKEKYKVMLVGDDEVEYFLNTGWEIMASAPNPHPCPYIFFAVRKSCIDPRSYCDKEMHDQARKYKELNSPTL